MKIRLLIFLLFALTQVNAQDTIRITDFGVEPDSRINVTPSVEKALRHCANKQNVVLFFPKGRYDFWPSYCKENDVTIGFKLKKMKNITIEGNGSDFIFHGRMQIARIDSCENVTFKNFSVDWDRPFISQGEIMEVTNDHLDLKLNETEYPYIIENGKIVFVGEGWKSSRTGVLLYDKVRKEILPQTWDSSLGDIFQQRAEKIGNNVVRFFGKSKMLPPIGTIVSLSHARYLTVGIHIIFSKNTILKDLIIYHALSHGVLGEMSENITMDNASMTANEAKGRVFSTVADASHFVNCKGLIKVENCAHTGQYDDFINVHGRNLVIKKIIGNKTIEVDRNGWYNLSGDEVWFLDRDKAQRGEVRTIESIAPVENTVGTDKLYLITFTQPLPSNIKVSDIIENKTRSASLELRNCKILKKNRARGILVTTPKDVIIENNYFRTAGTAILIEGDIDHWFESGANNNVHIRNNIFEDCLTSGNKDGNRWQWGDAVITITPSHKPLDNNTTPYHNNIFIYNNTFKVFDAPLLRVRSVNVLKFNNNEIIKTNTYEPYAWQKSAFLLDGCRKVEVKDNIIDNDYKTRDILIEHMKKSDIKVSKGQGFNLDFVMKGFKTYLN